jgi:hypothetical protein
MKRIYLGFALAVSLTFSLNAQSNSGGFKLGLNLVNQRWVYHGNDVKVKGASFHGGIYGKFFISREKPMYVQPEVMFNSLKASKEDIDITLNYISVPVMFLYEVPGNVNFQAGPQLGVLVHSTAVRKEDNFRRLDFSLNLGFGVEIKKLTITGRYSIGLINVAGEDLEESFTRDSVELVKNSNFQISLGMRCFGRSSEVTKP